MVKGGPDIFFRYKQYDAYVVKTILVYVIHTVINIYLRYEKGI